MAERTVPIEFNDANIRVARKFKAQRDALVKALEDALANITDTAKITCSHFDRKTKKYVFNDEIWKAKSPGSFAVAERARAALVLVGQMKDH